MKTIQEKLFQTFLTFEGKTAIEYGDKKISYSELDKASNKTANAIRTNYDKGTFVGVLIEDRADFIATMIGILKAGCVFVPLEPSFPTKRLESIIESAELGLTICDNETIAQFSGKDSQTRYVVMNQLQENSSEEKPDVEYLEKDAVYIYHTSGSTGQPKAVLGMNISLLHFIAWEARTFNIDDSFRCSQLTNVGFDVFLRDTLVALCAGGCLCIPERREIMLESNSLIEWIDTNKINLIHCVPSIFGLLNSNSANSAHFESLKYILLAGEKIRPDSLRNWFDTFGERVQLVNLYGPTETTLAKVFYLVTEEDKDKVNVPVGKPIDGAQVIILNEEMAMCDQFETGEVYIRTPFRSFGYFNNAEMTAEKFIRNPFTEDENDIIYKTGDLGRVLPDGNIELLGRVDRQVKIRGMRIELEEIERTITKNPLIKEALVVKKELSETAQFLYAYATLEDQAAGQDSSIEETLMGELNDLLPQYMVPAYIIMLDEIPRKINGKVDYSMLMDPLGEQIETIAPRDEIESELLEIWKEILDIEEISVDDSFFEKGGNSLNLMNLILEINESFEVEINFEQIALENTIERQATFIKKATKQTAKAIPVVAKKEYYQTSAAQRRLYYMQEIDKESSVYNLPSVAEIKGKFDRVRFENALKELIKMHETLRTHFDIKDDALVQVIKEDVDLEIIDFQLGEDESIVEKMTELVTPFNLTKAPLSRVFLCEKSSEEHIVVFDFHHIIFDGYSQSVFIDNFATLYNNEEVQELRIQYKDYAEYQNSDVMQEIMLEQEAYWLDQFKGLLPTLKLPEIKAGKDLSSNEVAFVELLVDEEKLNKLKAIAQKNDTTLFTVLLTAYYMLLAEIGNEEDIIVGMPTNGRDYAGLDKIIGMFVNTIALRQYPEQSKTFNQLLSEVKSNMIKALEFQNYQYDELVNKLNLNKPNGKKQLFEVMFQMQKREKVNFVLEDIEINTINVNLTAEFKLNFNITENEDHITVKALYKKVLFNKDFIEQLIEQYESILDVIIENNDIRIEECVKTNEKDEVIGSDELMIEFDLG